MRSATGCEQHARLIGRAVARRRRVRRILRHLPRRTNIHRYPVLRHFASAAATRPYLWSYRPGPVTVALYAGSVISFLPLVGITLFLSLAAAILFRANLTVTVALQFVSNPLTSGPLFAGTYLLGDWVLGQLGIVALEPVQAVTFSLVLGGVVAGLVFAAGLDLTLRLLRRRAQRERALLRVPPTSPRAPDPSLRFGCQTSVLTLCPGAGRPGRTSGGAERSA